MKRISSSFLLLGIVLLILVLFFQLSYLHSTFLKSKEQNSQQNQNRLANRNLAASNSQSARGEPILGLGDRADSAELNITHKGKVILINTKGGVRSNNAPFKVQIRIETKTGPINFYYNDESIKKVSFFMEEGVKKTPITISEIQPGDTVTIHSVINFMEERGRGDRIIRSEVIKVLNS